ncbi:MAG: signal peptidase I [Candidatus Sabulitectum sp.]|nr:signal peptidase I [Candidatus Sabulitectum sp.]
MNPKLEKYGNWFLQLALALLVFFGFLRPYVIEAYRIPTPSMSPTLPVGDHLLVLKSENGQQIPFSDRMQPLLHNFRGERRWLLMPATGSVELGESIVFRYPVNEEVTFIKRVVAVEGDSVRVRNDTLYVNGEPSPFAVAHQDRFNSSIIDEQWPDCLPYLNSNNAIADLAYNEIVSRVVLDNGGNPVYIVPVGNVFMMGDNRDHSSDSRIWGSVDLELVKGQAVVTYWSWQLGNGLPKIGRIARLVR